jgi:hypothetical protein
MSNNEQSSTSKTLKKKCYVLPCSQAIHESVVVFVKQKHGRLYKNMKTEVDAIITAFLKKQSFQLVDSDKEYISFTDTKK